MINKIVNAITKTLSSYFGKTHRYYAEDIPQNLKTPCFTVQALDFVKRSRNPSEYDVSVPLVVHYFPKDKLNSKKEQYKIGEIVCQLLEYLTLEDDSMLRSESVDFNLNEDVLQIFVTYKFILHKVPNREDVGLMEILEKYKNINK